MLKFVHAMYHLCFQSTPVVNMTVRNTAVQLPNATFYHLVLQLGFVEVKGCQRSLSLLSKYTVDGDDTWTASSEASASSNALLA